MANVLVVAHHTRSEVAPLLAQLRDTLTRDGHHMWMCSADARAHSMVDLSSDRDASDADLVGVLGGDGTVLRAISMLNGAPVPVLGVNVGVLGYLTEVGIEGAIAAVHQSLSGKPNTDYIVDQRMLLQVSVSK
ncbi:MAG: NAD(+)/NADH kinase, partial [Ilumatobacteraceae bacterium]